MYASARDQARKTKERGSRKLRRGGGMEKQFTLPEDGSLFLSNVGRLLLNHSVMIQNIILFNPGIDEVGIVMQKTNNTGVSFPLIISVFPCHLSFLHYSILICYHRLVH
jgi:hypothetical protein